MKKSFVKLAAFLGLTAMVAPVAAFADNPLWNTSSTTDALTSAYTSIGIIIALALGAVLGAWAALHGLGYGVRKAQQKVIGRAF